jgi:AcrR family transcriptional regulator
MAAPKREHLLQVAESVFASEGFKGVSVDRVLAIAGVAKMTLYKGFESKDALICETLRRRASRLETRIRDSIANAGDAPNDQLLSCFDAMEIWSQRSDFNGCYFINALAEFGADDSDISQIVRSYKLHFLQQLETLSIACDVPNPKSFAQTLLLLIDGATVTHMTLNDTASYARAKAVAAHMLGAL